MWGSALLFDELSPVDTNMLGLHGAEAKLAPVTAKRSSALASTPVAPRRCRQTEHTWQSVTSFHCGKDVERKVSQVCSVGRARELCRAAQLLVRVAQSQAERVLVAVAAAIHSRRIRKRDYAMRGFFSQILRFVFVVKHRVGQLVGGGAGGSRALRQR
jgi:hypothetical protein